MLEEIVKRALKFRASDIHLSNGYYPIIRKDGDLIELKEFGKNDEKLLRKYKDLILSKEESVNYAKYRDIDLSLNLNNTRMRVNIYKQQNYDTITLRIIPEEIPKLEDLGLPVSISKFMELQNGLVLITGMTGSGKSTTMASILNEINKNYSKHIITIEDPIEFIFKKEKSLINQREVGKDVSSYSRGVKSALRADLDIIMIGELRDLETIQNAITLAETGHLVFSTLHTRSVPESIDRIIDVFPANQQSQIRHQIANSIEGIISQHLYKKVNGGRIPVCEIMFTNDGIRNGIKEGASTNSILDQMIMSSRSDGSQTRLQSLAYLYKDGLIDRTELYKGLNSNEVKQLDGFIY